MRGFHEETESWEFSRRISLKTLNENRLRRIRFRQWLRFRGTARRLRPSMTFCLWCFAANPKVPDLSARQHNSSDLNRLVRMSSQSPIPRFAFAEGARYVDWLKLCRLR